MMRVAGSRSQLPLLPHSLHDKSVSSGVDLQPFDDSYHKYYLFSGLIHIKWIALAKNVLLLAYLIWMMKNDLVQQQMECFRQDPSGNGWYREACTKNICLWLHYIALAPGFLIQRSIICLYFLFIGALSCVLMLGALHLREKARIQRTIMRRQWIKYLMVMPGLIFELFVAFVCYHAIFVSVEWRVLPTNRLPTAYIARAVIFAIILSGVLLSEIVLHLMSVWYVCERQRDPSTVFHCGHPSPSESVLEMLKHPLVNVRMPTTTPTQHNSNISAAPNGSVRHYLNDSHRMSDSANVSFESAGYGRLRRVMLRTGTANHSPASEGDIQCVRDSVDCTARRPSPHIRQVQTDLNASNNSDYQQIRGENFHHLARNVRTTLSSAALPDLQDSTYLEVI